MQPAANISGVKRVFVMTLNKKGLKKAVVAIGCAALVTVSALTVGGLITGKKIDKTAAAQESGKVESTSDMVTYLLGYGTEVDIASAKLEKARIPKKFDESFVAFNEVIKQSGGDLEKYRNKKIEKWSFTAPGRSAGDQTAQAVLLVYKDKVIGTYILLQPSGEVQPLAAATSAQVLEEDSGY